MNDKNEIISLKQQLAEKEQYIQQLLGCLTSQSDNLVALKKLMNEVESASIIPKPSLIPKCLADARNHPDVQDAIKKFESLWFEINPNCIIASLDYLNELRKYHYDDYMKLYIAQSEYESLAMNTSIMRASLELVPLDKWVVYFDAQMFGPFDTKEEAISFEKYASRPMYLCVEQRTNNPPLMIG